MQASWKGFLGKAAGGGSGLTFICVCSLSTTKIWVVFDFCFVHSLLLFNKKCFYLRIVSGWQKSYKDSAESSHVPPPVVCGTFIVANASLLSPYFARIRTIGFWQTKCCWQRLRDHVLVTKPSVTKSPEGRARVSGLSRSWRTQQGSRGGTCGHSAVKGPPAA